MRIRRIKAEVPVKEDVTLRRSSERTPVCFDVAGDPAAVSDAFIDALAQLLLDVSERVAAKGLSPDEQNRE